MKHRGRDVATEQWKRNASKDRRSLLRRSSGRALDNLEPEHLASLDLRHEVLAGAADTVALDEEVAGLDPHPRARAVELLHQAFGDRVDQHAVVQHLELKPPPRGPCR